MTALPRLTPDDMYPVVERLLRACDDDTMIAVSSADIRDLCYAFIAVAAGGALAARQRRKDRR